MTRTGAAVGAVCAAAAGCFAAAAAAGPVAVPPALLAGALALMIVAELLCVRVHFRGDVMALSLFEAVLVPAIALLPPVAVLGVAATAQVVAHARQQVAPLKIAFNAAQWTIAAAAGSAVFRAMHGAGELAALAAASTAVVVVNLMLFGGVLALAQGRRFGRVAVSIAPAIAGGWLVGTALAVLFLGAYRASPATAAAFVVPLVALHVASRERATLVADRARLAQLERALRTLAAPIDPTEAVPRFLAEVQECFGCSAADLVLAGDGGRTIHRINRGVPTRLIETSDVASFSSMLVRLVEPARVSATGRGALAAALRSAGWRECLAAPLVADGHAFGVLCVYDRSGPEGFEDGELAVLRALAGEAASMIRKGELLEAILAERRTLAEIVGSTSDGILTVAPDGRVLSWNRGLETITGYVAARMVGTRDLSILRPRDATGSDVFFERWAEADAEPPGQVQIVTSAGATRWLACTFTRLAGGGGAPRMLIGVVRDATEAVETERLKDDFVATVSHELRTPLTPIRGWGETLLRFGTVMGPEERNEAARSIVRQAERLERLITNLLHVSRIEREPVGRPQGIVDVAAAAARVADEYRASNRGRTILVEVGSAACEVVADELWVEQILGNLLSNAMRYAPATEPVVVRVAPRGTRIEVDVVDRGSGIPPAEWDRVFERFHRLGDHMTRADGGTGLGLYISRRLAEAMGGTLSVVEGHGGAFRLVLPAAAQTGRGPVAPDSYATSS